jgi:predicted acyl esterase
MSEEMREQSVIADNMRLDWDMPIPMDDGVVLRADIFRPIEEGTYPVLLSYGPYGKGLPFQVGYRDQWEIMAREHPDVTAGSTNKYQNWEVVDPEKWVPHGYACVRVDSRGAGRSPGYIDPFAPRETQDLYHCIEWAGRQSWSNGKVGLNGISYYAINQWHVASLQPPHLAAICPWEGAADFYRDMTRHGGILCDFWGNWFKKQVMTVQHGLGRRGPVNPNNGLLVAGPETLTDEELAQNRTDMVADALAHPLDDAFYRERSPVWEKVTVPLLSAGNWGGHGLHLRGNVEGFVRAASPQKWLEIHGLQHWIHFYTDYGRTLQKRFFDHFLKGIDNGWEKEPRMWLQIRHIDTFVGRPENEWPLARTQWTKLYVNPARQALSWERVAAPGTVEYAALGDGVTFLSPPLERETEVTGPAAAKLFVSSSTVDADLFVTLRVFAPDGREVDFQGALDPHTPIAQGWLRASQRKLDPTLTTAYRPYHTHDERQLLRPGEVYELDVEIWPTSIVIPPGYQIALTIQGKDFERPGEAAHLETMVTPFRGSGPFVHTNPHDRPVEVFGGRTRIHGGGAHPSYLLLPIIPASG